MSRVRPLTNTVPDASEVLFFFFKYWLLCRTLYLSKFYPRSYLKPAITLSSVLFPAPDGPSIAVNWPDLKTPLTPRSMVLFPIYLQTQEVVVTHELHISNKVIARKPKPNTCSLSPQFMIDQWIVFDIWALTGL